ncbi:Fic family protein [Streptomyces sp. NPDC049916]|uniref:Fic family protein n=1 Tax=Streptomyces sp. NPDC049916 TaxID=3155156 RepID=UPI0034146E1D
MPSGTFSLCGPWACRRSTPARCHPLHEKAAALLHALARSHALIDGDRRTARLAMRCFLRVSGTPSGHPVPPAAETGLFVEAVARTISTYPRSPNSSRSGSRSSSREGPSRGLRG